MRMSFSLLAASAAILTPFAGVAHAQRADARVQAPELKAPGRGSVAGDFAGTVFGAGDASRGGFHMGAPMGLPPERGTPHLGVLPGYSPESGVSEWGLGWNVSLALTRSRVTGSLEWNASDDLTGPWGRMVRGSDGMYYPLGLSAKVRVQVDADAASAYLPDGTRVRFGLRVAGVGGTYAWYVTDAEDVHGARSRFTYVQNASGRPFLTRVEYGGRGDDFQARADFTYAPLGTWFRDFRSGREQVLDQRVRQISAKVKDAATGAWVERYAYDLGYQQDEWGPAFYLASIDQKFASGERAPQRRFGYEFASDTLQHSDFRRLPELTPVLASMGEDTVQPNVSTLVDLDDDGRPDLEHAFDQSVFLRRDAGFERVDEPRRPDAYYGCKPEPWTYNTPRLLARLTPDAPAPQVLAVEPSWFSSDLIVCARDGSAYVMQTVEGDFSPGENVHLTDLDRDHRPDLIRVFPGGYEILPNLSVGTSFRFGAHRTGVLATPAITPVATWLQDMNGDGLPDLVSRTDATVVVWHGLGGFAFEPDAHEQELISSLGIGETHLDEWQFRFVDANHDGLTDVLLTRQALFRLFANNGTTFVETPIPALLSMGTLSSPVVVADLAGSGNTEILYTEVDAARSLALDGPGTGLLASADDGKGTVVRFAYRRGPATPGGGARPPLLATVTVDTAGLGPVSVSYEYAQPRVHGLGRFLLGYAQVVRRAPDGVEKTTFLHEDRFAGLPVDSVTIDPAVPALEEFAHDDYDVATLAGVAWARPKTHVSGWRTPDRSRVIGETTEYETWSDDVCPARVHTTSATGDLISETTRAVVPQLGLALHCLSARTVVSGSHLHPQQQGFDFHEETAITRDARGQVTRIEALGPQGARVLQDVAYDAEGMLRTITAPGHGTTRLAYSAGARQLASIATPDGMQLDAQRDPRTDAILALTTVRPGGLRWYQEFHYDGLERLDKRWDDATGTSAQSPAETLAYRYASATSPAAIASDVLVDVTGASHRREIALIDGGGAALATATAVPGGWAFGPLTLRRPAALETRRLTRPTLPAGDPLALDFAGLAAGAAEVSLARSSRFAGTTTTAFHDDVRGVFVHLLGFDTRGKLLEQSIDNDELVTTRELDAHKQQVALVDPAGTRWEYAYDLYGRLREVRLPDGARHTVSYDNYGQVTRVWRSDAATVTYSYDATTGLLTRKLFASPTGAPVRTVTSAYDAIGQLTRETHTAAGEPDVVFDYARNADLVTRVSGPGFVRALTYRSDGKLIERALTIAGWRTVVTGIVYAPDGSVRQQTVRVLDANGAELERSTQRFQHDAFGRPVKLTLDPGTSIDLDYDGNNQLAGLRFTGGERAALGYDALTHELTRFEQRATSTQVTAATTLRRNRRGLIDSEAIVAGTTRVERRYGYGLQGYLTSAVDALTSLAYAYDASGRPASSATRVAGFDAIRRTVQRGELTLHYGADGQVAWATRGARRFDFIYDESGQRLAKLEHGAVSAAYLEEGLLAPAGLSLPVEVAGHLVGVVHQRHFVMVGADWRGTIIAEASGTPRLATPFGDRAAAERPELAAIVDFVQKGYDADLGVVRMGVRDYAPDESRFLTPDPLFLERPDLCVGNPVSCNLEAYARNNPLSFSDPSGTEENGLMSVDPPGGQSIDPSSSSADVGGMSGMSGGEPNFTPGPPAHTPLNFSFDTIVEGERAGGGPSGPSAGAPQLAAPGRGTPAGRIPVSQRVAPPPGAMEDMNEHGAPPRPGQRVFSVEREAAQAWREMRADARAAGFNGDLLDFKSAFRDQEKQDGLAAKADKKHGADARTWVAKHSEHLTGKALDLNLGIDNTSEHAKSRAFEKLPIYQWLKANAGRYGFNPYDKEPWHWSYNVRH